MGGVGSTFFLNLFILIVCSCANFALPSPFTKFYCVHQNIYYLLLLLWEVKLEKQNGRKFAKLVVKREEWNHIISRNEPSLFDNFLRCQISK